jgi:hypothetical protein
MPDPLTVPEIEIMQVQPKKVLFLKIISLKIILMNPEFISIIVA